MINHMTVYPPYAQYENADSKEIQRRVRELDLHSGVSQHSMGVHYDPIVSPFIGLLGSFGIASGTIGAQIVTSLVVTAKVGGIQIVERMMK